MAFAILVLALGPGRMAAAQTTPCCFEDGIGARPGIEFAVERYYQSLENAGDMEAHVYRFDSEANALASLEAIDAGQVGGVLPGDAAIQVDALGPNTRAYAWVYDTATANSATILTVEETLLYIVSITVTAGGTVDAVDLATTTIQGMIATNAGADPGEYDDSGYSTGGLWDKLPPGDDENPPGYRVFWDEQLYPVPNSYEFDFATLEGIQDAVSRQYSGDTTALQTPETAPATTYFLTSLAAGFDTPEHAETALEPFHSELLAALSTESQLTMESVDPGDLGDRALAAFGSGEQDGVTVEVTMVSVQADAYLYLVRAVGVGVDAGALETATAVIQAMIDAEAGDEPGEFDEYGESTGGLWDKLPVEGDDVLGGLIPETDEQVYPALPEE
jgi:hypothetical protein